jgi:hypothetical protein
MTELTAVKVTMDRRVLARACAVPSTRAVLVIPQSRTYFPDCALSVAVTNSAAVSSHQSPMPPPKKNVARLRSIAAERWAVSRAPGPQSSNAAAETVTGDAPSDSDNDVYLLDSDEEIADNELAIERAI